MDHGQFKVTLKTVDKKFAYTICKLELTNMEVYICICMLCVPEELVHVRRVGLRMYIHGVYVCM